MDNTILLLVLFIFWCEFGDYTFRHHIEKETGSSVLRKACFLSLCGPVAWLSCLFVLLYDYFKGRN